LTHEKRTHCFVYPERAQAKKMKATTLELKSGHVSILSHPKEVAAFIIQALASVTLTTIGCNDIIPVHPLAQGLVMVEGLVGQLYPVIIISSLAGLTLK
jgi:hypothetical protein